MAQQHDKQDLPPVNLRPLPAKLRHVCVINPANPGDGLDASDANDANDASLPTLTPHLTFPLPSLSFFYFDLGY